MGDRIVAVFVTYKPDPARLRRALDAVRSQVESVLVVDNGNGDGTDAIDRDGAAGRIDMAGNAGLAAAQNAGLRRAFAGDATHVLLLDQDSIIGSGAVVELARVWHELADAGVAVAAVGANHVDPRRPEQSAFVALDGWAVKAARRVDGDHVPVAYLISAGSLISRGAFDAIGPMTEDLFIDYVDIEWGLRAEAMRWRCYGAWRASMEHALGERTLRFLGRRYPLHSAQRLYYMTRNGLWLIARPWLSARVKVAEGRRWLLRTMAYALIVPGRRGSWPMIAHGIRDALVHRLGAMGERSGQAAHAGP